MTLEDKECDVDDIVCQVNVLSNLKNLESSLGNEEFANRYPEAAVLREKIRDDISTQEMKVSESLAPCTEEEKESVITINPKVVISNLEEEEDADTGD